MSLNLTPLPKETPPEGFTTPCRLVRIVDGDTAEVEITRRVTVRMQHCWAPESRTKNQEEKARGIAAKNHLTRLTAESPALILHVPGVPDQSLSELFTMGRVVGVLWLPENRRVSLNERMIRDGHATASKAA